MTTYKKHTDTLTLLFCFSIILSLFFLYSPSTTYWRDSGEFIIAAYFQDISHPAGFPLYAQLTNTFTLLPFGPIAWRVNFASCVYAVIFLFLSFYILKEINRRFFKAPPFTTNIIFIIYCLVTISAPVFIKQIFSAEVYILNAVIMQLLVICFLKYQDSKDLRWFLTAAFISGLGIGNHVTITLAILPFLIYLLFNFKHYYKFYLPLLLTGFLGLLVYAYIPVRNLANPPLNTGNVDNIERFINLISNQRGFKLQGSLASAKPSFLETISNRATSFLKDMQVLGDELSLIWLFLALSGFIIFSFKSRLLALILLWCFISHWYFFKRWPPDPWMPLLWLFGLFACLSLIHFSNYLNANRTNIISKVLLTIPALVIAYLLIPEIKFNAEKAKEHEFPQKIGSKLLMQQQAGDFLVAERSWFILKYLQDIEGLQPAVNLVYSRQITHPKYFESIRLKDTRNFSQATNKDPFLNLKSFTDYISSIAKISFEPASDISNFYKHVAVLNEAGQNLIIRGQQASYNPSYSASVIEQINFLKQNLHNVWKPVEFEALHYVQSFVDSHAQLLKTTGQTKEAIRLYNALCETSYLCNTVLMNNLALSYLEVGNPQKAIELLESILAASGSRRGQVEMNLKIAKNSIVGIKHN